MGLESKTWLLRKSPRGKEPGAFLIQGPYSVEATRDLVKSGELAGEDELCGENSYWFSVQEHEELKKYIGVDFIAPRSSDDEPTQPDIPELDESHFVGDESQTGFLSRRPDAKAPVELQVLSKPKSPSSGVSSAMGQNVALGLEKNRLWTIVFASMVVLAVLGIIWVLRSLQV